VKNERLSPRADSAALREGGGSDTGRVPAVGQGAEDNRGG
jgi:hypothetical protein